jgi:hypothetical protein
MLYVRAWGGFGEANKFFGYLNRSVCLNPKSKTVQTLDLVSVENELKKLKRSQKLIFLKCFVLNEYFFVVAVILWLAWTPLFWPYLV